MLNHSFQSLSARPRQFPSVHFKAGYSKCEDINPLIGSLPFNQFRRHVNCGSGSVSRCLIFRNVGDDKAEIDQLHGQVLINNHVSRTDIAVNPVLTVEVLDRSAQFDDEPWSRRPLARHEIGNLMEERFTFNREEATPEKECLALIKRMTTPPDPQPAQAETK